jgi:hypothetical protein
MQRLDLRELHLVVDAERFGGGRRDERGDLDLVLDRHRDDVGQVVLALRVRIPELAQPFLQ